MPDNSILDLTDSDYVNYENQIISLIRESRPELDLRVGTAIRDILVRTSAQTSGAVGKDIEDLRAQMSLKLLEENPDLATEDVVESLASNYGITRRDGIASSGYVSVYFQRYEELIIPSGYSIQHGNFAYATSSAWKIRFSPAASDELPIYTDETGKFFAIVPFTCLTVGSSGNVEAGQSFDVIDNSIILVTNAVSYSDLSGGKDQETVEELLARITESMSHRELTSQNALSVRLKNEFPSLNQVSTTGFGDPEQLRDKHNVFGVAVGSRVDVWCKTYTEPARRTIVKSATKVSDGTYKFTLVPSEVGVIYKIAAVNSPESIITLDDNLRPVLSSYPFTETRFIYNSASLTHDVSGDEDESIIETAYSPWQGLEVTVTGVGATSGSEPYPASVDLRVDVYVAPNVDEIQTYLDADDVRNREADILARGVIPAFVELSIPIYRRSTADVDLDEMRTAITDYVNNKKLGEDLTLSQLSSILHQYDILKVGTGDPDLVMVANVRGADGTELQTSGSELRISDLANAGLQVSESTTSFVADVSDVYLVEKVVV